MHDAACSDFIDAGTPATGTQTCNGNGDGRIPTGTEGGRENISAWKHLSNAGLVEGNYTGVMHLPSSGPINFAKGGFNAPKSKFAGGVWGINDGIYSVSLPIFNNGLCFGADGEGNDESTCIYTPILKPEDAYNLDMKTDDGKPLAGKIQAINKGEGCETGSGAAAAYQLGNNAITCSLYFATQ